MLLVRHFPSSCSFIFITSSVQAAPVAMPEAKMEVEDQITDEMMTKMEKKAKESFKTRPKRKIPDDLCTPEAMKDWKVVDSYTAHKTASPAVKCVAQRAEQPDLVLSGGEDGQVLLYSVSDRKVQRSFTGHKKAVNAIVLHPTRDVVISASDDKTVRLWVGRGGGRGQ